MNSSNQTNGAIDIAKWVMAVLVIGIHTEPFHFNLWLDRGFGIVTRLCLPFFFIASAYFFFQKKKPLGKYLGRLLLLYVVWSLLYLPFDLGKLRTMSVPSVLARYLWSGNEHALWYLQGTVIGTLIVCGLKRLVGTRAACAISFGLLVVGCLFSTYVPLVESIAGGYRPKSFKRLARETACSTPRRTSPWVCFSPKKSLCRDTENGSPFCLLCPCSCWRRRAWCL